MAVLGKFIKQPAEVLDYEFDFRLWLADRNDAIASVTVTAAPTTADGTTPLTIANITQTSGIVRFYAAGGSPGIRYGVTCTITTAAAPARVKQDEMTITVKEL